MEGRSERKSRSERESRGTRKGSKDRIEREGSRVVSVITTPRNYA